MFRSQATFLYRGAEQSSVDCAAGRTAVEFIAGLDVDSCFRQIQRTRFREQFRSSAPILTQLKHQSRSDRKIHTSTCVAAKQWLPFSASEHILSSFLHSGNELIRVSCRYPSNKNLVIETHQTQTTNRED
jgi:hypothetical protein